MRTDGELRTAAARRPGRAWASLLLCLLSAPLAHAREPAAAPIGVIAEYRPSFARYVLQRGKDKAPVPARIGTTVMAGDTFTLPRDGVLVVQLADQSSRRYSGPGTYALPAVETNGRLLALLESIPDLFEDQHRRYGNAASRGSAQCGTPEAVPDPIVAPIVGEGAQVGAGRRDLQLAWRGGCKPFAVRVVAADGRVLHDQTGLTERRLHLTGVELPAGRYAIVIADGSGGHFEAPLEAVAAPPALPDDIAGATGAVGDVARGAWWLTQAGANWRLAAYEALRPSIDAGDGLAVALGDSLLTGRAPP